MKAMLSVAAGLVCAATSLGLLFWAYPWSVYYGNFTFGYGITLRSYVVMALFIGVVVSAAASIVCRIPRIEPSGEALAAGLIALSSLILISLLLGPCGADLPGTRIAGIFFSEFKFMNFIGEVALPSSIVASGLSWCFALLKQRSTKH